MGAQLNFKNASKLLPRSVAVFCPLTRSQRVFSGIRSVGSLRTTPVLEEEDVFWVGRYLALCDP